MTEQWIQVISLFFANAGLIIWFRAESRSDWRHMDNKVDAIQKEMKDFHARLEKQDAEFKGKLALQDAEFKSYLMNQNKEVAK